MPSSKGDTVSVMDIHCVIMVLVLRMLSFVCQREYECIRIGAIRTGFPAVSGEATAYLVEFTLDKGNCWAFVIAISMELGSLEPVH